MKLLDVEFGALAHPAPQNRASLLVHFEHVFFRLLARETENALEHHRDVRHQIDGVVMHDNLPWEIEFFGGASLLLDHRIFDG